MNLYCRFSPATNVMWDTWILFVLTMSLPEGTFSITNADNTIIPDYPKKGTLQ
jgi:hypothetical protein